jgi:hypothetical protein
MRPIDELPKSWAPGFHGVVVAESTLRLLEVVADVMIPGDSNYPSGSAAGVPDFIANHISAPDLDQLDGLLTTLGSADREAEAVGNWLAEAQHEEAFNLLRWYVYTAYYASPLITEAMNRRGIDYHGPPQPLGYRIEEDPPRPQHDRGSYTRTEEVQRVIGDG